MSVTTYQAARPTAPFDPVRFCVFTTVALLCWLCGAPVIIMAMSALGLWAYRRAIRSGLKETRCKLKHPAWVLAYLIAAFLGALVAMVRGAMT